MIYIIEGQYRLEKFKMLRCRSEPKLEKCIKREKKEEHRCY